MMHWWLNAWHWLVIHSLWQYVIGWFVTASLTFFATALPWRRHRKAQADIADKLDPSTPGGVTDVIQAIQSMIPGIGKGDGNAPDR